MEIYESFLQDFRTAYMANGETSFICDGIMGNIMKYENSPYPKVLFIGKEPHYDNLTDQSEADGEDYRSYGEDVMLANKNWYRSLLLLKAVRLVHENKQVSVEDLQANMQDYVTDAIRNDSFGFVNLKKSSGEGSISDQTVLAYAQKYKSMLRRQLDFLNPDIIICWGGCKNTTQAILDIIYDEGKFQKVMEFENGKGIWKSEGLPLVVEYWHPGKPSSNNKYLCGFCKGYSEYINR